jgi:hypothetical protein
VDPGLLKNNVTTESSRCVERNILKFKRNEELQFREVDLRVLLSMNRNCGVKFTVSSWDQSPNRKISCFFVSFFFSAFPCHFILKFNLDTTHER